MVQYKSTRWWLGLAALAVLVGFCGRIAYKELRWKRFGTVVEGRLYRSGQLTSRQFQSAVDDLHLKTVICLNGERVDFERAICAKYDVGFYYFPMPADGQGQPEQFAEIHRIVADPRMQPVLIHCNAGVARTGAAIALYRMANDQWTNEQAIEELRSYERNRRCEPSLVSHIQKVFTETIRPLSVASGSDSSAQ